MFKLGVSEQDYALMEEESYRGYLEEYLKEDSLLCHKLTKSVLPSCSDVSASQQQLKENAALTESQLRQVAIALQGSLILFCLYNLQCSCKTWHTPAQRCGQEQELVVWNSRSQPFH